MKILWLTEFFPKDSEDRIIGGIQARCFYVARQLRKSHHLQIVEGVSSKYAKASFLSFAVRLFAMPGVIFKALNADFDLVEASNGVMYFPAWLVAKIKRKPIVFWYPDVYLGSWVKNVGPVGIIGEILERLHLFLKVDSYIAISNSVKDKLIQAGVNPKKITVIYCGVSLEEIESIKVTKKKWDVIAVSRLIKYKRLDDLIKSIPDTNTLVIIGWGPEKNNLRKIAGTNVTFLGTIPSHKKVLEEIASSKILCHPSVVEGFGIAIIEALALGVPTLLADTRIAKEITHNWQGALPFSTENMKLLLTDKKLYFKKSEEGKKLARSYSWAKIAKETEELYESLHNH